MSISLTVAPSVSVSPMPGFQGSAGRMRSRSGLSPSRAGTDRRRVINPICQPAQDAMRRPGGRRYRQVAVAWRFRAPASCWLGGGWRRARVTPRLGRSSNLQLAPLRRGFSLSAISVGKSRADCPSPMWACAPEAQSPPSRFRSSVRLSRVPARLPVASRASRPDQQALPQGSVNDSRQA